MISKLCATVSMAILPFVFKLDKLPSNLILLIKSQYFGRLNFVTFWSILLTNITCTLFIFKSISNYFAPNKNSYSGRLLRVTMSVSYPITILVTAFYWIAMFLDRSIIYPKALENDRIPLWREFTLHLAPMLILSLMKKSVPINVSAVYILSFCLVYACMNFFSFYKTRNWPYGLMTSLSINQNIFLHFGLGLLVLMLFILLRNSDSRIQRVKKLAQLRTFKKKNK